MNRLKEVWFEFCGRRSTEFGVEMLSMPVRGMPLQRGKARTVASRHGSLWLTDNTYDAVEITLDFEVPDESTLIAVNAWLHGSGLLRFSDEPGMAYEARIARGFKRQPVSPRMTAQHYSVVFSCHPFRLQYPEADPITLTVSGSTLKNPGTAPARPRVKIAGYGDFSVSIGLETLFFSDVSGGGIIVDSKLMDAFTYDGASLANSHFSGTPYEIVPGTNVVSWLVESGSAINSIEILPRWRYI